MKTRTKWIIVSAALAAGLLLGYTINGNLNVNGTISSGVGSGQTGVLNLTGKTSGEASSLTVDDNNTVTSVKLPNDGTSGLYVSTSTSATPSAGCAQWTGTGTQQTSTGTSCGGGGGGVGANRGLFGSAPTCNGTFSGGVYYSTDVPIIEQCNGSTYQPYAFGSPVVLPGAVSFTWQNQGGSSVNANGFLQFTIPTNSGDSVRGYYVASSAAPFRQDACFNIGLSADQYTQAGIYESDGTKLLTFGLQNGISGTGSNADNAAAWAVSEWTSVTAFSSRLGSTFASSFTTMYCLRWYDDGTNNNWCWSQDPTAGGSNTTTCSGWNLILTAGNTAWLTPTRIGVFFDQNKNTGGIAQSSVNTLWHWWSH